VTPTNIGQKTWNAALDLTQRADFLTVSNIDENGFPETRIVFNLKNMVAEAFISGPAMLPSGFETWIATNSSSRKIGMFKKNPKICLYYTDTGAFQGLSVRGTVSEELDNKIRHAIYTPIWDQYYKGGVDGGDFSLFRFKPVICRYYHGLQVIEFDPLSAQVNQSN